MLTFSNFVADNTFSRARQLVTFSRPCQSRSQSLYYPCPAKHEPLDKGNAVSNACFPALVTRSPNPRVGRMSYLRFSRLFRLILHFSLNRALFPKIDIDNDNQVSMTELYGWLEQHMKKHVLHGTDARLEDLDSNKDGKISWEEYREVEFPSSIEKG